MISVSVLRPIWSLVMNINCAEWQWQLLMVLKGGGPRSRSHPSCLSSSSKKRHRNITPARLRHPRGPNKFPRTADNLLMTVWSLQKLKKELTPCFIQHFGSARGACLHSTNGFVYLRSLPPKTKGFLVSIDHTCTATNYLRRNLLSNAPSNYTYKVRIWQAFRLFSSLTIFYSNLETAPLKVIKPLVVFRNQEANTCTNFLMNTPRYFPTTCGYFYLCCELMECFLFPPLFWELVGVTHSLTDNTELDELQVYCCYRVEINRVRCGWRPLLLCGNPLRAEFDQPAEIRNYNYHKKKLQKEI